MRKKILIVGLLLGTIGMLTACSDKEKKEPATTKTEITSDEEKDNKQTHEESEVEKESGTDKMELGSIEPSEKLENEENTVNFAETMKEENPSNSRDTMDEGNGIDSDITMSTENPPISQSATQQEDIEESGKLIETESGDEKESGNKEESTGNNNETTKIDSSVSTEHSSATSEYKETTSIEESTTMKEEQTTSKENVTTETPNRIPTGGIELPFVPL